MLTGRSALEDRVRGLEGGADVYMTKPVDLLELSSVIRSLARRMRLAKSPRPADAETRAAAADTSWSLQDGGWILVAPDGASLHLSAQERTFLMAVSYTHLDVYKRQEDAVAVDRLHLPVHLHRAGVSDRRAIAAGGLVNPRLPLPRARLRLLRVGSWPGRMRGLLGRRPPGPRSGLLLAPCRAVHTFGTVSYTHLDGYKRQAQQSARAPAVHAVRP